ncbi:MAG TPA: phosphoribosylanthranilate isomerase [Terracidiphilus sp.]|jgi:phosphoribosylanthranilate isomerase
MSTARSIWVKVCANTSLQDARVAAEAGADAVGFVFAPSPRRVTASQVGEITSHLPGEIEKIGVFADAGLDEICAAVRESGLTGVQLHCDPSPELPAQLRRELGPRARILRVVHFGPQAAELAKGIAADANIDGILVDSRTATAIGGTGIAFDWAAARAAIFQNTEAQKRLIAAGGLTAENVREAITTLHPWGVDVASGVEAAPGRKDPEKVRRFVANARAGGVR